MGGAEAELIYRRLPGRGELTTREAKLVCASVQQCSLTSRLIRYARPRRSTSQSVWRARSSTYAWTNVIVFALWYWELDGGGPPARLATPEAPRDFAFPQMTDPQVAKPEWHPRFVDYLYLSFTNASAFGPSDTLPLTRWAKLLMMLQSSISIVTLILVAARAVNMLG